VANKLYEEMYEVREDADNHYHYGDYEEEETEKYDKFQKYESMKII
jgi:hypothetical protein